MFYAFFVCRLPLKSHKLSHSKVPLTYLSLYLFIYATLSTDYFNSKFAIEIIVLYTSICLVKYLKDEDFIMKFGQKLKQIREEKGISQEQLALLTEISQSQIARTELGQINTSISHVSTYAKFLKVEAMVLFDFTDLKVKTKND